MRQIVGVEEKTQPEDLLRQILSRLHALYLTFLMADHKAGSAINDRGNIR